MRADSALSNYATTLPRTGNDGHAQRERLPLDPQARKVRAASAGAGLHTHVAE